MKPHEMIDATNKRDDKTKEVMDGPRFALMNVRQERLWPG
jgi:hypothetical protein